MPTSRSGHSSPPPRSSVQKSKGRAIRREEPITASLLPDDGAPGQTIIIAPPRQPSRVLMVPPAIIAAGVGFSVLGVIATIVQLYLGASWLDSFFIARDEWAQAFFANRIFGLPVRLWLAWVPAIIVQMLVVSPGFFTAETALIILYGEEPTTSESEQEKNWFWYIFWAQIGAIFLNMLTNFLLLVRATYGDWDWLGAMIFIAVIIPLAALWLFPAGIRVSIFGVKRLLFIRSQRKNQRQSADDEWVFEDGDEEIIEISQE